MKLINRLLAAGMIIITLYSESLAADLIQATDYGDINWSKGILTGQGPNLEAAQQNLWEMIEGLRLNNRQQVAEVISRSKSFKAQLQQLIQKAKTIKQQDSASGQPLIKLQFPLKGAFIEALLATQPTDSVGRRPARFGRPTSPPGSSGPRFMREITGLVVDARGLRVAPAINPQILSEDGHLIYGTKSVSRSYIVNHGLLTYMPDMALAEASKRVANNPMLVKALTIDPEAGTDLIISNQDAQRINRAAKRHDFLYKCRVITVIDQPGIPDKH